MSSYEDAAASAAESFDSWIEWFCSKDRNQNLFCAVDVEYIKDEFNLTGLNALVPHYRLALDIILDYEPVDNPSASTGRIEKYAEVLYGLIHARYILTQAGMKRMDIMYKEGEFERCPRHLCKGQDCLPVGISDTLGESHVMFFCPRCQDVYNPRNSRYRQVDGAFFGTTFPHLYLLAHHQRVDAEENQTVSQYVPKIFGFRIHKELAKDA
ncbi:protein kinase CK2beta regulatory subunit [Perkinsela sp. CCAP 1560/4]|nr:protein kinase CK2beta regulatory subunit [Perkinsela sp. CCAP 1560/4]KNH08358.1 protein kinase CK2beta regulatory subunit [Perkinsela sp. CCAP 1560/4]|eukprot:KNH07202.1 protein kinase CK2beta regulatory subunit [Perkinsela sp. CCAP 1560/4]